ncbi:hypothetical protein [Saccharospirillum impatiens]|uniref:hypothetical protein n=1 Tax=Saccharospirillum impatiens TaxID=169438 RepID=UPI0003FD0E8F|nr:hypothetical protein [Saccharospirillum impatiens]
MGEFFGLGVKLIGLTLRHLKSLTVCLFHIVVPRDYDIWPDIDCASELTKVVSKGRKLRSKGQPVTPTEDYVFHSDFATMTDGNIWIIRTDSNFVNYSVAAGMFGALALFILAIFLYHGADSFQYKFFFLPPFVGMTITSILAHWEKGHNRWIVFDRSSRSVCFWHKNKRKSLTVPFDQVHCYWHRKAYRGGASRNFMLMPEVSLRGEWNRWWNTYFGSTEIYSQAQYLWRVLSDFMDNSKPIPELPGLTHQIRSCQKLGYTIEDLTHGGKEIPIGVWMEVDKDIENEIEALDLEVQSLLKPERFSASEILEYSKTVPPLARRSFLSLVMIAIEDWSMWTRKHGGLYPGMEKRFTQRGLAGEIDQILGLVRSGLRTADEEWEQQVRKDYRSTE